MTRQRSQMLPRGLMVLLLSWPTLSYGQGNGAGVRPGAIVIIDAPASMNLTAGSDAEPLCGNGERSRFLLVREALTGRMVDYGCNIATGPPYPIDNFPQAVRYPRPQFSSLANDGLIDRHSNSVRFGLLVSDPEPLGAEDARGGYSYGHGYPGRDAQGNSITVSLGVRNEDALVGALYGIGDPGVAADVRDHNQDVQDEINKVIPYGESSLAALLRDTAYYFDYESSISSASSRKADNRCRPFRVLLFTDGSSREDYDNDRGGAPDNPYGAATDRARELALRDVPVHVFLLDPNDDETLVHAEALAAAGGTGEPYIVRGPGDLTQHLDTVLNEILAGTDSRTRGSSTFQTHDPDIGQLQVSAAFTIPNAAGPWQGHLERLEYKCGEDQPDRVVDFGELLDTQGRRDLFTSIAGRKQSFETNNTNIGAAELGVSPSQRDALIDFVRGEDTDFGQLEHRLGAIVHSDPAVVGPPLLDLPFPSYQGGFPDANGDLVPGYRETHADRPTMAYVGANDGTLHAFVLAATNDDSAIRDSELWAYVPGMLLNQLLPLTEQTGNVAYVDAPPVVRTVRLKRSATTPPEEEVWMDVLLGGLGPGGRGWYALDVSDPKEPKPLWELPGKLHPGVDKDLLEALDGYLADPQRLLGESWGRAAFGTVVVKDARGDRVEKAVAFVPGGRREANGSVEQGRVLYVVQIEPDDQLQGLPRILKTFRHDLADIEAMDYPIVGTPVAFQDLPGTQTTRVFVGDSGGQLWRVDTGATDPDEWRMDRVFDPWATGGGERRAAVLPPALTLRTDGRLVVVYATGDPTDLQSTEGGHRVYSLTEELLTNAAGQATGAEMKINWRIDLQDAEQATGPPLIFDETVYLPTLLYEEGNVCGPGIGHIWSVDYIGSDDADDVIDDVLPRFPTAQLPRRNGLVEQAPPACNDELPDEESPDRQALYCALEGAVISGLEISYVPACQDELGRADLGGAGRSAGKNPVLVAQTGGARSKSGKGTLPRHGGQPLANKISRKLPLPTHGAVPLMWGVVFD